MANGSVGITALFDKNQDVAVNGEIMINETSGMISMKNVYGNIVSYDKASRSIYMLDLIDSIYSSQMLKNFKVFQCDIETTPIDNTVISSIDLKGILSYDVSKYLSIVFDIVSKDANGMYHNVHNTSNTATLEFPQSAGYKSSLILNINDFTSIDFSNWKQDVPMVSQVINTITINTSKIPNDILLGMYIVASDLPCNSIWTNQTMKE